MLVAICDDDPVFRSELKRIIVNYKREKRLNVDIYEFETGEKLLCSTEIFDIIFIDFQMPGLDGLETAKVLRKRKFICCIIFITNYPQFVLDSFEVQPFRFFVKPITENKVISSLDSYLAQKKLLNPIIVIDEGVQYTINSEDIIYLEASGKNCIVRTNQRTFRSSKTLSKIENVLPLHCFYRIHKSYIINMYCISEICKNEVTLINGEKATISRPILSKFKKSYANFVKNYYLRG